MIKTISFVRFIISHFLYYFSTSALRAQRRWILRCNCVARRMTEFEIQRHWIPAKNMRE